LSHACLFLIWTMVVIFELVICNLLANVGLSICGTVEV
jgi:hypothetical protein